VPQLILGGGLAQRWRRWELSLLAKHVGSYENDRFLSPAIPRGLGDFMNLGAHLAYWFGRSQRSKVYLGADNLLDERYSTVHGYPDAGLAVTAGVSLVF